MRLLIAGMAALAAVAFAAPSFAQDETMPSPTPSPTAKPKAGSAAACNKIKSLAAHRLPEEGQPGQGAADEEDQEADGSVDAQAARSRPGSGTCRRADADHPAVEWPGRRAAAALEDDLIPHPALPIIGEMADSRPGSWSPLSPTTGEQHGPFGQPDLDGRSRTPARRASGASLRLHHLSQARTRWALHRRERSRQLRQGPYPRAPPFSISRPTFPTKARSCASRCRRSRS